MTSKMEFSCKLAHLDATKKLSNFSSQKELFERISQNFCVPLEEILYCTINSHNFRDTDSLLGNYLSSSDLIVAHLCGQARQVSLKKTRQCLGLTITDNGFGRAFVKRVAADNPEVASLIKPGDHIAAINSQSMVSLRHYEVAEAIRAIELNTTFTMSLIEPKHASSLQRGAIESCAVDNLRPSTSPYSLDLSSSEDLIHSSLPIDRLLSKSNLKRSADQENSANNTSPAEDSAYRTTIDRINSIMESFLGINDNLLAIQIYRLAHENQLSFEQFRKALKDSELSVFNFDPDLQDHLWNCASNSISSSSFQ